MPPAPCRVRSSRPRCERWMTEYRTRHRPCAPGPNHVPQPQQTVDEIKDKDDDDDNEDQEDDNSEEIVRFATRFTQRMKKSEILFGSANTSSKPTIFKSAILDRIACSSKADASSSSYPSYPSLCLSLKDKWYGLTGKLFSYGSPTPVK